MRQRLTEEELISAYLDGEMGSAERAAFEARLTQDVALRRRVLATRLLVEEAGNLPAVALPRNFILPPDAGRIRPQAGRPSTPFLRWAFRFGSVAATIAFVALVASEALPPAAPAAQPEMAAPELLQPMAAPAGQAQPPAEAYPPPAQAMPPAEAADAGPAAPSADAPAISPRSLPQAGPPQAADAPPPQADRPAPTRPLAALAFVLAAVLAALGWGRRR